MHRAWRVCPARMTQAEDLYEAALRDQRAGRRGAVPYQDGRAQSLQGSQAGAAGLGVVQMDILYIIKV